MNTAAKAARAGDKVLSILAIVLMVTMLAFGGYSLWDTYISGESGRYQIKSGRVTKN